MRKDEDEEAYLFGEKSLDDLVPSAFSFFIRRHLVVLLNNKNDIMTSWEQIKSKQVRDS